MPTIKVEDLEPGQVVVCAIFQPHEEYEEEPDDGEEEGESSEDLKVLKIVKGVGDHEHPIIEASN